MAPRRNPFSFSQPTTRPPPYEAVAADIEGEVTWPLRGLNLAGNADDDDQLVIGIDFGTTFSGVAWATAADFTSDQINLITSWPGTGLEEGKAPTELFYEDGMTMWGYGIPVDADPIRWFKLLLLRDEDLDPDVRASEILLRGRRMLKDSRKSAVDLVADYLQAIWRHTLDTISRARGEFVVGALRFHVVITVPAIWKGYARQGMEDAARKAGILNYRNAGETTLSFVPEPEAAALSTLCEPGRRTKKGDVYVICDAGGGTVDLISYRIAEVGPIAMEEAVEGTGGLCGGVFIDEAFEHMCSSRLGRRWDHLSKAGIKEIMKGEWEKVIKPQYKPQDTRKEYIVGIPAEAFKTSSLDDLNREPYIKKGRVHFRSSDIQQAFADSFAGIDALIERQVQRAQGQSLTVKGIILVGGLGASPYLYEHLNAQHSPAGIAVLQSGGMKPRTAICRGAIYKGFLDRSEANDYNGCSGVPPPIQVTSTISRVSLGVRFSTPWDDTRHHADDKKWNPDKGIWEADNQMRWYIRKGDNIRTKGSVAHPFHRLYKEDFGGKFHVNVYQCDDDSPPSRKTSAVTKLCKVDCQLDIPFSQLDDFKSAQDGKMIKKLRYSTEMIPSGAAAEFKVSIHGRRLGSQNTQVRFQ